MEPGAEAPGSRAAERRARDLSEWIIRVSRQGGLILAYREIIMKSLYRAIIGLVVLGVWSVPSLVWAQGAAVRLQDGAGAGLASVTAANAVKVDGSAVTQPTSIGATRNDAATAATHSHTSAATLTLTPTAGQFVYITGIDLSNCEGAVTVTVAAPTYLTTTNLTGAPQYQIGSGPGTAPGVCSPASSFAFATPLRATAVTTAVTVVLPTFIANQTVSVNVYWYSAP